MATWPTTADLTNLLTSAGITLDAAAEPATALASARSLISWELFRTYGGAAEARTFNGENTQYLQIDPCQQDGVTKVELLKPDGTVYRELESTEWALADADGVAHTSLIRKPNQGWWTQDLWWAGLWTQYLMGASAAPQAPARAARAYLSAYWPAGVRNVRVTATWGDAPEPPDDVAQACLYMAALQLLGAASVKHTGGVTQWQHDTYSEQYAGSPFKAAIDQWGGFVAQVLTRKRLRWAVHL